MRPSCCQSFKIFPSSMNRIRSMCVMRVMTLQLRLSPLVVLAACSGALLSSCIYEPYGCGPSTSISSSVRHHNSGHVSSSIFIRTSSSRWGYDPHCRSYYDHTRQCYYDPWLRGYYPRGYRPPVIIGIPHPYGWKQGQRTCPPPVHIRTHTIRDHRCRYEHYRRLNHSWCRQIRTTCNSDRNHHQSSQNISRWTSPPKGSRSTDTCTPNRNRIHHTAGNHQQRNRHRNDHTSRCENSTAKHTDRNHIIHSHSAQLHTKPTRVRNNAPTKPKSRCPKNSGLSNKISNSTKTIDQRAMTKSKCHAGKTNHATANNRKNHIVRTSTTAIRHKSQD